MAERVLHSVGQVSLENKKTDLHFAMRGLPCASADCAEAIRKLLHKLGPVEQLQATFGHIRS